MQKLWCEISPNKLSITINDEVSNQIDSTDIFCRGFWFPEAPINSHAHKSDVAEFSLRVGGKKLWKFLILWYGEKLAVYSLVSILWGAILF